MNNILIPEGYRLVNEGETIENGDLLISNIKGSTSLVDWRNDMYGSGVILGKVGLLYHEWYPRIRKIDKTMKIKIDNKEYIIDIERAKTLGVLKDAITVRPGDKFVYKTNSLETYTVISLLVNGEEKYIFGGVSGVSHHCFSMPLRTHDEFVDYITSAGYKKIS